MAKYKECDICIYQPCHKVAEERTYCLTRYLIWECDERERKRREERRE